MATFASSLKLPVKQYEIPSAGSHTAILANIEDLGPRQTPRFGVKDEYKFIFYVGDALDSQGKPFVLSKFVAKETGPNSTFTEYRKVLNPNLKPANGVWDLAALIGCACRLAVCHKPPDAQGRIFANIEKHGISPLLPDDPSLTIPEAYRLFHPPVAVPAPVAPAPALVSPGAAVAAATGKKKGQESFMTGAKGGAAPVPLG